MASIPVCLICKKPLPIGPGITISFWPSISIGWSRLMGCLKPCIYMPFTEGGVIVFVLKVWIWKNFASNLSWTDKEWYETLQMSTTPCCIMLQGIANQHQTKRLVGPIAYSVPGSAHMCAPRHQLAKDSREKPREYVKIFPRFTCQFGTCVSIFARFLRFCSPSNALLWFCIVSSRLCSRRVVGKLAVFPLFTPTRLRMGEGAN